MLDDNFLIYSRILFSATFAKQKKELIETGKVKGFEGHHINNVKEHPDLAGNPDNIKFLKRSEHLQEHGGNFRNETHGELLNRQIK